MTNLKFQHVFAGLLALCVLTAFVMPERYSEKTHPEIQALFAPVSYPVGAVAQRVRNSVSPDLSPDRRQDEDIRHENQHLRDEVSRLYEQMRDLQERDEERNKIGPLRQYCKPFAVIGGDPGLRESLLIRASTLEGIKEPMPVVYPGGIAGQIQRAGIAGAQVQLISDTAFHIRGSFKRYINEAGQLKPIPISNVQVVANGNGNNQMLVRLLTMQQVAAAGIRAGDVLVVDEPEWPNILRGTYLGHIVSIEKSKTLPLFADIRIEPQQVLMRLREVLVVTKGE
jgi:cell shape-determining protein MreC